ncbi:MAG: hypothetical protein AAGE01_17625 [Pseudomonadota bacterium]
MAKIGFRRATPSPLAAPSLTRWHNTGWLDEERKPGAPESAWGPWQGRFDWVLDGNAERRTLLANTDAEPRSLFLRSGDLSVAVKQVLPRLTAATVVYLARDEVRLTEKIQDLQQLLEHPRVSRVFAENVTVDVPGLTAMPVGFRTRELVTHQGGADFEAQRSIISQESKRRTVLVVKHPEFEDERDSGRLRALGLMMRKELLLARRRFGNELGLPLWRELSHQRFALMGWGLERDTSLPWQALGLGTIPILRRSRANAVYADLPVLLIDDLRELTAAGLDQRWRELSPRLADTDALHPDFWWHRIARHLRPLRRAFLVVGPESSGTHFVTEMLIAAGCHGHAGDHPDWESGWTEGIEDTQPWDHTPPTTEDPVVWRKSVPHGGAWPDLTRVARGLVNGGYAVTMLVVNRDPLATAPSQLRWKHVRDLSTGFGQIERALAHCYAQARAADVPTVTVSYEALIGSDAARRLLLGRLRLDARGAFLEIRQRNEDRYRELEVALAAEAPKVAAFPEHWFPVSAERWLETARRVREGQRRMAERRVLICGIARNIAATFERTHGWLERLGQAFDDYRIFVFESDSDDATPQLLQAWAAGHHHVTVRSASFGHPRWTRDANPERLAALATCRNQYLDHAASTPFPFDLLLVVDLDLPDGASHAGVAHSLSFDGWDVIASNGLLLPPDGPPDLDPMHFDAFAFRPVPGDGPGTFSEINALRFERGAALVSVGSAFGGLALYSRHAALSGARYDGPDCEHVVFHEALRDRGYARQFLNPHQVVIHRGSPWEADR